MEFLLFLLFSLIVHMIITVDICLFPLIVLQEDPVLLVPEDKEQKPYVAIIKVTHGISYYFSSICVLCPIC